MIGSVVIVTESTSPAATVTTAVPADNTPDAFNVIPSIKSPAPLISVFNPAKVDSVAGAVV